MPSIKQLAWMFLVVIVGNAIIRRVPALSI